MCELSGKIYCEIHLALPTVGCLAEQTLVTLNPQILYYLNGILDGATPHSVINVHVEEQQLCIWLSVGSKPM